MILTSDVNFQSASFVKVVALISSPSLLMHSFATPTGGQLYRLRWLADLCMAGVGFKPIDPDDWMPSVEHTADDGAYKYVQNMTFGKHVDLLTATQVRLLPAWVQRRSERTKQPEADVEVWYSTSNSLMKWLARNSSRSSLGWKSRQVHARCVASL